MKSNQEDAKNLYNKADTLFDVLEKTVTDPLNIPPHLLDALQTLAGYDLIILRYLSS